MYESIVTVAKLPASKNDAIELGPFSIIQIFEDKWSIFWPANSDAVYLNLHPSKLANALLEVKGTFTLDLLSDGESVLDDDQQGKNEGTSLTIPAEDDGHLLQRAHLPRSLLFDNFNSTKPLNIKITLYNAVFRFRNDCFVDRMRANMYAKTGDIIVKLAGGTELCLHSQILALSSPVFDATLKAEMKEKTQKEIDLSNYDEKAAKCLLDYLYTGCVSMILLTGNRWANSYNLPRCMNSTD